MRWPDELHGVRRALPPWAPALTRRPLPPWAPARTRRPLGLWTAAPARSALARWAVGLGRRAFALRAAALDRPALALRTAALGRRALALWTAALGKRALALWAAALGRRALALWAAALVIACGGREEAAEPLRVAVAANFSATQQVLAARFTEQTGVAVEAAVGSSGQLFAQIRNGAPFHVFLSADRDRPAQLEVDGLAAPGSRFAYAEGRLVLYGPTLDSVRDGGADLRGSQPIRVALANPETAPYGAAAEEVLQRLEVHDALAPRLARGESVAQVEQFVRSGAAELGFVSLAQVIAEPKSSYWLVPAELHRPLLQDAVLLQGGTSHPAARAYLDFLRSDDARSIIEAAGYAVPTGAGG